MILLRNDVPAVLRELVPSTRFLCRSSGVPEKPEIDGPRKPAIEGDHITLTCITHGSKPAADLRWFRNEKEIKGESHLSRKLCLGCFLKHSGTNFAAAAGGSEQVVPNRADLPPDFWPDSDTTYPLLSQGGSEITPTGLHT